AIEFAEIDDLGKIVQKTDYIEKHIEEILKLKWVDVEKIKAANFKVVVDGVNSTGGIAIPQLLRKLGVEVVELYCEPNGHFTHDPVPLEKNLKDLFAEVLKQTQDLGLVVDPDVDRIALLYETGYMFVDEYNSVDGDTSLLD